MSSASTIAGTGRQVPPQKLHVEIWFSQTNDSIASAHAFFEFYDKRQWRNRKGQIIKDWKMCAWQWKWNRKTFQ